MNKTKTIIAVLVLFAVFVAVLAITLSDNAGNTSAVLPSGSSIAACAGNVTENTDTCREIEALSVDKVTVTPYSLAVAKNGGGYPALNVENATGGAADGVTEQTSDALTDTDGTGVNESLNGSNGTSDNEELTDTDGTEVSEGLSDKDNTEGTDKSNGAQNTEIEKNPFESAFDTVKTMSAEIFCALTFIGSMILAWAYKKGLLPLLQGGLGAISTAVTKIKEKSEATEGATRELSATVAARLEKTEQALAKVTEGLQGLSDALDRLASDADDKERLKTVLTAQIDMLYDIFMTSALPQYQKDAVGERISKMKEALGKNEE